MPHVGRLEVKDMLRALDTFGDRYGAVDVFADDLTDDARLALVHEDVGRRAACFGAHGIVRLARGGAPVGGTDTMSEVVAAATRLRGAYAGASPILCVLVGRPLGSSGSRHVFVMEFDVATRTWAAYDGGDGGLGLVRHIKQHLAATDG